MHPLIRHFSHFTTFTPAEEKAILDSMTIQHVKKDDVILKANAVDQSTFFVIKGLVRKHKLLDGNDLTLDFFSEDDWIISLNSFTEGKAADYCLTCLEDTELITGNEEAAQALFKIFPRFETISRAVMESTFLKKQEMLHAFQTDSPVQRYENLLKNKPALIQRIPQYYTASYLGITPESLSRIRKRMTTQKTTKQ